MSTPPVTVLAHHLRPGIIARSAVSDAFSRVVSVDTQSSPGWAKVRYEDGTGSDLRVLAEVEVDLSGITGYRTNEDNSQTLAWLPRAEDGLVECIHEAPNCCTACFEADGRLFRNYLGDVIAILRPADVRTGRLVRH